MSSPQRPPRRGFLEKSIALVFGLASLAVPSIAGILAFLNPWRQKGGSGDAIRVANLASLAVGGPPQSFPVIADRTDAWNRFPAEPIGTVFLRRVSEQEVAALQAICPHAGCLVGFDGKAGCFQCPCHGSKFDAEGRRTEAHSISPRDLDGLEVEIRNRNEVWLRFRKFQTGTPEKIAKN